MHLEIMIHLVALDSQIPVYLMAVEVGAVHAGELGLAAHGQAAAAAHTGAVDHDGAHGDGGGYAVGGRGLADELHHDHGADGKYLITLTNGETIELVQGSEAEAVIPIVSINDKGEWQVSTDNGATFTSLGVKAVAEDGTTPRFRIDEATGYWQVSYDGGTSFENVKDTKGQPVKAKELLMVLE